jgi:hypothetical protein
MNIKGTIIKPSATHKFLGVIVDERLSWRYHVNYAIGKGTAYTLQLCRLATAAKGLPMPLMCQLYTSVALPKLLYTVNVWFTPLHSSNSDNDNLRRGSITTTKKLERVQHIVLLSMTGALRTTATDSLEAHTNLMPLTL